MSQVGKPSTRRTEIGQPLKQTLPSLRLLVSTLVLAPIVAISVALLAISGYTSGRIESQLSASLVRATSTVVTREVNSVIGDAQWVSDLYTYRVQSGVLPAAAEPGAWDKLMVGTLSSRMTLASLAYATPDGRCVMVMRVGDNLIASHSDGPGAFQTREYHVTPQGQVIEPPIQKYSYDATKRLWYTLAMQSDGPAWTPVYTWFDQSRHLHDGPRIKSLGYTRVVRMPDGKPAGVLSVDVTLETVSNLLRESDLAGKGTIAILDERGRIVSDAGGVPRSDPTTLPHINTVPGDDMRALRGWLSKHAAADGLQTLSADRYVNVESLRTSPGINWRLATVVPEVAINGETRAMRRNMLIVGGLCVLATLVLGATFIRRMTNSVHTLMASVRRIGRGDFDVTFGPMSSVEFTELTAALTDMTAQLKEQVTLRAAKEAAESANRAKSAFFARATHELRTPLNAIIGYSELIEEQECVQQDEQTRDDIRRVLQASKQLLAVINNVLDLAKIESGKLAVTLAETDIPALLRETIETAQPLAQQNGNTLRLEVHECVGTMRTDAGKLRQILLNLLANSARFTNDGSITLLAECDNLHLHLAVKDSGTGIPADKIGKLFEPFYQADERRGGTGLGLSITRQLTYGLGGAIEINSILGEGTTVDLYFPLTPPPSTTGQWNSVATPAAPKDSRRLAGGMLMPDGKNEEATS